MLIDAVNAISRWSTDDHWRLILSGYTLGMVLFAAAYLLNLYASQPEPTTQPHHVRDGTVRAALVLTGLLCILLLAITLGHLALAIAGSISTNPDAASGWQALSTRRQLLPLGTALASGGGAWFCLMAFRKGESDEHDQM